MAKELETPFSFEFYGISDVGLVREQNEDSWIALREKGIFILADGMGGHNAGEVASKLSVEALAAKLTAKLSTKTKIEPTDIVKGLSDVNSLIYEKGHSQKALHGMGTTIICLVLNEEKALYGHVGDSRLYLFRDEKLKMLTEDHTLINELIALGTIEKEEKTSTFKHILTRAIGTHSSVEPTLGSIPIKKNDVFLLCSDGLTNFVVDKAIGEILNQNISLENKGKMLVELAKINGGGDNITLILVQVKQNDIS